MEKHFINLTNGLEWVKELPTFEFVRIESTAIERNDWTRIYRDLDANFLMCLALGYDCHFYDCGTNRERSKTVSTGIPMVKAMLIGFWLHNEPWRAETKQEQDAKRKLTYFKRYLNTDRIRLTGHSKLTTRDGDKEFYRSIAVDIPELDLQLESPVGDERTVV